MYSARFRQLLGEPGPFTSVYFDGSAEADDTAVALALKWRGLRDNLEQYRVDASITAEIEHAVMHLPPPGGRGGRAVIASATGVILNEYLLRPATRSVVRVSELPYIVPILEHGVEHTRYLLVVADPHGAFITRHTDFTRSSEAIEAEGDGGPTLRAVADRVGELVRNTSCGAVFLVGDADLRSGLLAALPESVRRRVIPLPIAVRRGGYDFEEIQWAVDTMMLQQRRSAMDTAAERFIAEVGRGSGLAVEGLGAVCAALRQGVVDTMLIGDIDDATVVADAGMTTIAPDADALLDQGAVPAKTLRADEALPLLAISVGASVVRTDERIAPVDGVGAVLRYPAKHQQPVRPPALAGLPRR
jgi:peptide chain release factor subunit 1